MSTPNPSRAGFWDRAVALALDLMFIGLLIAALGVALTAVTDGKVRVSNTLLNSVDCTRAESVPAELQLPAGFKVSNMRRCTHSVFGIAHDWTLTLIEETEPDTANGPAIVIPLDRAGRVTRAFYLDDLIPFLLAAYLFLCEWRYGTTIGKRIFGIRVRALGGAPMDVYQASKRILMRMVPLIPLMAGAVYSWVVDDPLNVAMFEPHKISLDFTHKINMHMTLSRDGALDLWPDSPLMIVFVLNFIVTTARRTLPLHDWWAKTEAVRP